MKTRCMCGKPDTIRIAHSPSITEFIGLDDNILHFKAADRYCERCGRGLCEDCAVVKANLEYMPDEEMSGIITLCPDCADILEGK